MEYDGYHRLADLMNQCPQTGLVRRFTRLRYYCLLSEQAELTLLEDELEQTVFEDRQSQDPEKQFYEFQIELLKEQHADPDKALQWNKITELRSKLRHYGLSSDPLPPPNPPFRPGPPTSSG